VTDYADMILRGKQPSEISIYQADKFTTVVNLKTAKALGFTIPPTLLARADEVIEYGSFQSDKPSRGPCMSWMTMHHSQQRWNVV
jgi:hypothetical protein